MDDSLWDTAKNEAWIQVRCREMWKAEIGIYNRLADLQGSCVPQLYHEVTFDPLDLPPTATDVFEVPGILIEYIDGFTLEDVHLQAPQSHWQYLCDQAMEVVNRISDRNVLNQDVRRGNMIVRKKKDTPIENGHTPKPSDPKLGDIYDVLAIDFGLSRLRRPNETDDQWREAKFEQHEDENIGLVMASALKKSHGVELNWYQSRRYDGPWTLERFESCLTYEHYLIRE